jgi:hypothetical protein
MLNEKICAVWMDRNEKEISTFLFAYLDEWKKVSRKIKRIINSILFHTFFTNLINYYLSA